MLEYWSGTEKTGILGFDSSEAPQHSIIPIPLLEYWMMTGTEKTGILGPPKPPNIPLFHYSNPNTP